MPDISGMPAAPAGHRWFIEGETQPNPDDDGNSNQYQLFLKLQRRENGSWVEVSKNEVADVAYSDTYPTENIRMNSKRVFDAAQFLLDEFNGLYSNLDLNYWIVEINKPAVLA